MGFLSDLVGGITGSTAAKASKQAGQIQSEAAQSAAADVSAAGQSAIGRFDPLAAVGQQGIDLAGFLGDPSQQASFLESNPLFQLGLKNLNKQTQQSAASRGRLTAGDTLAQLQQNAQLAGQPLIDRQRQDIMNLLGLSQNVAGAQAGIEQQTAGNVGNLLTGGAAASAAGTVGAANARSGVLGNILNIGATPLNAFAPEGSIFGGIFGGGN